MFKAIKMLNRKQFTNPQGRVESNEPNGNPKHHNETF